MIKSSINLPFGRRLDLNIVREKKTLEESLFPDIKSLVKIRKGNRISRLFSKIFENRKLRRFFGKNLLIIMVATSFMPQTLYAQTSIEEQLYVEYPLITETKVGVSYPVEVVKITQNYGFFHPGIDFDGITGDNIHPIAVGKVEKIQYSKFDYGNAVYVNHGNEVVSLYAHLSKILVAEGDIVSTDTVLGEMGSTGRSSGDHLHLEVYEDGKRVNPLTILY